ncbi:hypothetical protein KL905_004025 [Ogataea polymorpha]|nr:hypothetical protein KL935_003864 [Ogataea polymorpha]KAG7917946.1 hypothetical protein KL905_004025 [Ogataea polymorpha]
MTSNFNSSRSNTISPNQPAISDYSDLYDEYMADESRSKPSTINTFMEQNASVVRSESSDFIPYTREQLLENNLYQGPGDAVVTSDDEEECLSSREEIPTLDRDRILIPESSPEWQQKGAAQILEKVRAADGTSVTRVVRKSIKDFKLGKELGEGSYSTVVLGSDLCTGRDYAIKILNKRHIIKEKKVKYVNIEKNALNRLGKGHGIIHLFYTFQDEQNLYFVLDYAPNGELLSLIKKHGTMDEESVRYYSTQLVDAIDYMHRNGVIHRDIKPENILLNADMKIKITDFGTARILDPNDDGVYPSDVRANSFVGTAEYVSPELLNDKYCGKAADVWALGCIIYQMIAGKPPFKATNEYLTFQKVLKLQYAFSAGFPMVIRDLVKRILVLKPEDRITIQEIKKHYFFKDVDWNDMHSIWSMPPPELGPYKMSAKSMLPVPELNRSTQNLSPAGTKRIGSAGSRSASTTNILNSNNLVSTAASTPTSTSTNGTIFGLPNPMEPKKTNSSPVLPTEKTLYNPLSTAAAVATTKRLVSEPIKIPYLAGPNQSHGRTGRFEASKANSNLQYSTSGSKQNSTLNNGGSAQEINTGRPSPNLEAPPAFKSTGLTSSSPSSTLSNVSIQQKQASTQNVDLIPGTNIPRPVLNTRINASNSFRKTTGVQGSKSKQPFINGVNSDDIPPMSVLDLTWVNFLIHPDERVLKAGIVQVSKYTTESFEKKYKGMLAESPLGYKNKELLNSSNPGMIGQASSFRKKSAASIQSLDNAITFIELETTENHEEEDSSKDVPSERMTKLKNLFHKTSTDPVAKQRILVITTFGRAMLFVENHDRNKEKYQCVCEIDLINSSVHFREVIGDRRSKNASTGIFAIVSNDVSLAFEVDKQDLSAWTNSLAKSRFMEQERHIRMLMENDPAGDSGMATGNQAASRAANMAMSSPVETSPRLSAELPSTGSDSDEGPRDIRLSMETGRNTARSPLAQPASKAGRKPPPVGSQFPTSMRPDMESSSSKSPNQQRQDPGTRKMLYENSPMISAAISKALKNTTISSESDHNGLSNTRHSSFTHKSAGSAAKTGNTGGKNHGSSPRLVTSMNSKLLARTTRKKR